MCCFKRIWTRTARAAFSGAALLDIENDLLKAMCLAPLMSMNLRTPFLAKVSCSDASLSGGGVCVSRGLSEAGHVASSGFELERPCLPGAEGIILISLFDGIGGARRALDVLGMAVCCYICSEIASEAMRVVTAAWPEAEPWGKCIRHHRGLDPTVKPTFSASRLGVGDWRQSVPTTHRPKRRSQWLGGEKDAALPPCRPHLQSF